MTAIREEDIIIPEYFEESCDYSEMFDTTKFFMPAECFVSEEDYYFEKEQYYEKTIKYESETTISSNREIKYQYDSSFNSYFDMSDIIPAEIAIEDEIKMGYLWQKYAK